MASRERLPEPRRFQSVVEWQYPRAHRYWDECGKLIASIEQAFRGLTCEGLQPEGFQFKGQSKGITAARFYWDKANIAQVGVGDTGLAAAAAVFWPLVTTGLGPSKILRLGHRTWLSYETSNPDEAVRWLNGFTWLAVERDGGKALGIPVVAGSVFRSNLEVGGRRLRIEVNAGSVSVGKKETHGVIVDVDIVLEPPNQGIEPGEFIAWNSRFIRETVEPMFRKK